MITGDYAGNLIYYNNRLFFINNADFDRVYSMELDGSNQNTYQPGTSMFTIENGWIYYCNKNGLYRCRTDGSAEVQLADTRVSDLHVTEDYIYYSYYSANQTDANQQFYRMELDGKNREMITSDSAIGICQQGIISTSKMDIRCTNSIAFLWITPSMKTQQKCFTNRQ